MMTKRERMLATLHHVQPDRVPYQIHFTQAARERLYAYWRDPRRFDRVDNAFTGLAAGPVQPWQEIAKDFWRDPFGVIWNRSVDKDIGVVANVCVTPDNLDDYRFPSLDEPAFDVTYDDFIASHGDAFIVADLGFSLFERAWTLAGMENLLLAMAEEEEFAHRLLDRILDYNLQIIERACRHRIDAMMFGDDWGMQTGLIMGAPRWRHFLKPRLQKMYSAVKTHGKFVFIHSCGKVDEIFPDLIEIGLDVFNPFQPEVMDVFEIKRRYGDRLCFYGGISTQRTLPYATPEETCDEVKRLVREIGRNGGYIAAPAHAIPGDAKPENVEAMLEALTTI